MKHRRYSGFVRPVGKTISVFGDCRETSAIAGIAVASCMVAGNPIAVTSPIPTGTFNIGDPIGNN